MQFLDIALKDLHQIFKDRKSLLFLVAMPIAFTYFMGMAFQSAADSPDARPLVAWVDEDPYGILSRLLYQELVDSDSFRLVEFTIDQLDEINNQIHSGDLAAALLIPAGFSEKALADKPAQLRLIADPTSEIGMSVLEILRVPVTRLMSSATIARLNNATLPEDVSNKQDELQLTVQYAAELWGQSSRSGPQVVIERAQGDSSGVFDLGGNPYNQTSPGILVQFAVFSLVTSATILVQERKSRTMERMLTTSVSKAAIIAGHLLAMFAIIILQQAILVAFGQLVLGVDYARLPLGVLLVMLALGAWTAALGLLIGVLAKGEEQVVLYSMIAMFLISGLGGAWFPLETVGKTFAFIGKLTPGAWAMNGFQNILIRGLGFDAVLLPAGIMLLYALFLFGLALWRFRVE